MIELQEAEEFVDYYSLLDLPPDSDEKTLRKRIFALYEEAQRNLDHRNHRKRFYYAMLYETHLSRARRFLLDEERRARYDSYLRAFHAGQPFDYRDLLENAGLAEPPDAADVGADAPAIATPAPADTPVSQASHAATAAQEAGAIKASPPAPPIPNSETLRQLAAGLAGGKPVAGPAGPPQKQPAQAASGEVQSAQAPSVQAQPDDPVEPDVDSAALLEKLLRTPVTDPAQVERRRNYQRRELIAVELRTKGRIAGWCAGGAAVILGCIPLWKLQSSLTSPIDGTLSPTDLVIIVLGFALICGAAGLIAWQTSRFTRRQIIGDLSKMSYDELLRRCKN